MWEIQYILYYPQTYICIIFFWNVYIIKFESEIKCSIFEMVDRPKMEEAKVKNKSFQIEFSEIENFNPGFIFNSLRNQ